jgi:hypothetical protein
VAWIDGVGTTARELFLPAGALARSELDQPSPGTKPPPAGRTTGARMSDGLRAGMPFCTLRCDWPRAML